MGYPTRRVKVRRHNRNIRLHAMVVLGGFHVRSTGHSFQTGQRYFQAVKSGTYRGHYNVVTLLEECAEHLGLENV